SPSFHLLQLYCGLLTLHALPTRRSSDLSARMRPALGATVRSSAATTVDLPDPDGPVSAIRVPGVRSRSTPRTASSAAPGQRTARDRKSTRLNSSHVKISYAVFCLKEKSV